MGPVTQHIMRLSPLYQALDRNKPGTPESRAEDRLRKANANTTIAGYQVRRPGMTTLTGGLDPDVGQKL